MLCAFILRCHHILASCTGSALRAAPSAHRCCKMISVQGALVALQLTLLSQTL